MKLLLVGKNQSFTRSLIILFAVAVLTSGVFFDEAFAAQTVNDRIVIDENDLPGDIATDDAFGLAIENIGDLDDDGVIDLAVIKYRDDTGGTDFGSVLILFMNSDGTVKGTNEITMEDNLTTGIGNVCLDDVGNLEFYGLRTLAFVGDLDGDGMPTLALGAVTHFGFQGVVYMLELDSDGTVDNCLRIIQDENGFFPDDEHYIEFDAGLGAVVIATDLNGDGQNELVVSAASDDGTANPDATTNLWVFFLTSTGAVASHPATPILGIEDLTITESIVDRDNIVSGDTIDGKRKIVIGVPDGDNVPDNIGNDDENGSIYIINLTSDGAYLSSTEILGTSLDIGIEVDPDQHLACQNNPNVCTQGAQDNFGSGVAGVGDLNKDGINDIMVGNNAGDDTNFNTGEVFILFLNSDDTVKDTQKISNESENTRNESTPFAAYDFFGSGMTVWREFGGETIIAIGASSVEDDEVTTGAIHLFYIQTLDINNKSASPCSDCTAPDILIENEIVQNTEINKPNTISFSSWEDRGPYYIQVVEIGVGVKDIESTIEDSQARIQVWMGYWLNSPDTPNVKEIKVIDPDGIFVTAGATVTLDEECKKPISCLNTQFQYEYAKEPNYDGIITVVSDFYKNTTTDYYFPCDDCDIPEEAVIENEIIQHTEVGKQNTITAPTWEQSEPYHIQLIEIGLGVKDIESSIDDSQARIQVWMGYWVNQDIPLVKEITVIDPDEILVFDTTISITLDKECDCLDTEFHYTYAKEPTYDGMIVSTSDFYKNTVTNFLN